MLKKRSLYEVEYKDILKPETLAMLKGKAKQNLQQMLGDRSIGQALRNLPNLALEIQAAEAEYRDELEMVAKQIVTDAYPIIDYADIQIDAKIVSQDEIKPLTNLDPDEEDPAAPDFGDQDPEKLKAKRRIINGITQGAALKGTFAFLMFREYLDQLDPTLVDKYVAITKAADVPYNDENVIPIMMAQIEKGGMAGEGQSEMVYDDETGKFTIVARATNFPVLVHEIVKGLYEITGTEGFGKNKEKNQAIVKAVDKAGNEPEDLQIGRYFEEAISDLYNQSKIDDPRVRDFFFAEVYKLDEDTFLSFVENAVNGELDMTQKRWATDTMKKIQGELDGGEEDLYEDKDFDLSDELDENNFKKAIATGALALGLAGSPNTAKAQDKVPTPTTQQQDTAKTATATYTHPNENTARNYATTKAKAALAIKLGKPEGSISASVVDTKMYEVNGKYECTVTVKLN